MGQYEELGKGKAVQKDRILKAKLIEGKLKCTLLPNSVIFGVKKRNN